MPGLPSWRAKARSTEVDTVTRSHLIGRSSDGIKEEQPSVTVVVKEACIKGSELSLQHELCGTSEGEYGFFGIPATGYSNQENKTIH